MLVIPLETLAFIIVKAREFDAEVPIEPDAATGSDPPDDEEEADALGLSLADFERG